MAQSNYRVRFAPSPTGQLHLGGARTALFNWLFAKHHNGQFLLRIEDTDQLRSKTEYTKQICDSMAWLGMHWDNHLVYQSKRSDLYKETIQMLLSKGLAYRCFATKGELEASKNKDGSLFYPGIWRDRSEDDIENELSKNSPFTIRLKTPEIGQISFNDLIYGTLKIEASEIDDFIIARSDGSPVYNLVVVADDHEMEISHVIRGEDHVSNTFKQILIYQALNYPLPIFAHLPMILGPDKKRLSKRHGATGVQAYQELGYSSEALFNHLALLGWNPGTEQDIFSTHDLIQQFDLSRVQKKPAIFDIQKLNWISGQHLMKMNNEELLPLIKSISSEWGEGYELSYLYAVIDCLKQRTKTILDFINSSHYFFNNPSRYDQKASTKVFGNETAISILKDIHQILNQIEIWADEEIEKEVKQYIVDYDLSFGKVGQPLRLTLTGVLGGPSIFSIMAILGQTVTLHRIQSAITYFSKDRETHGK